MKILLTGATGYIGKRLLPVLIENGHEVIACTRDRSRFAYPEEWKDQITVFEVDFLQPVDLAKAPTDFDVAYYLVHSMSSSVGDFEEKELRSATNFKNILDQSSAQQVIYLTGIVNDENGLSDHLKSRYAVEHTLNESKVPLTALRAGIIVGSGSASFEIIRDLVEKLPVMIAPKWLNTKCQPIAIRNVIQFLYGVVLNEETYNKNFDIGSHEVLTYRQMLLQYAKVRRIKRWIFTVPIMTPRLSSYWLYFITSTSYPLAVNLVDSMKVDVLTRDHRLSKLLEIELIPYNKAVEMAFAKIEQNMVVSSWKDSFVSSISHTSNLSRYVQVPTNGVFTDKKKRVVPEGRLDQVLDNIWSIGGQRGWYYGNWMWKIRGYLDKLIGGIGLRRGRTNPNHIEVGDALDFWRVLVANKSKGRLLLYAEMKLPGDAWLEFTIYKVNGKTMLKQTATFRPLGLLGRLYWYTVLPFHYFVFNGMIHNLIRYQDSKNRMD